jgi:hypothetical protein
VSQRQDHPAEEARPLDDEPSEPPIGESAPPQRKRNKTIILGCGGGCLLALVVLAAVVVGIVWFSMSQTEKGLARIRPSLIRSAQEVTKNLEETGEIGPEHAAAYRGLISLAQEDDVSNVAATVALTPILEPAAGERGEANLKEAEAIEKFVSGNKDMGPFWIRGVPEEHVGVAQRYQRLVMSRVGEMSGDKAPLMDEEGEESQDGEAPEPAAEGAGNGS